ncbi:MAG: class II fructose-bisphosphate aldolase [Kiritimatiellae bacterium]|nr:class II fructose-bisphosphate aldolase [Kiritimatiellia bacterium]
MKKLMHKALKGGYAVPSFCVWNLETTETVLRTAERMAAPVIIMSGPGEFPLVKPWALAETVRALRKKYKIPAALHLDHGDSLDMVKDCLEAGFSSVMLDFSAKSFQENAGALRTVVMMAGPLGVTVEGELGHVGKIDNATMEGGSDSTLTDPDEAVQYVKETGVDALAVSIGNAHGNYTKLPQLDFERLAKIHRLVEIPLVLHGGSGTPDEDIKKAISLGIAKVNVASALVRSIRESLRSQWSANQNLWVPAALVEACKDMEKVVEKWIIRVGAAGRA